MKDIEKRKGFTLIELLVTIIIVALLFTITFSTVSNIFKSTENKDDEISEKFIINAAETYASEYNQNVGFKKFTNDQGKISFCVLPKTLLNYGLYNQYENIQEYLEDGYYIYIEGNLGVYDYEFIKPDDEDEIKLKCVGQQIGSDFGDVEESNKPNQVVNISENKGDTIIGSGSSSETGIPLLNVEYDFNIKELTSISNIKKYEYTIDLDFSTEATSSKVNKTLPVYVAFVLDESGTMRGNKFNNASSAIVDFSSKIINKFKNSAHISLVEFATKPKIIREFSTDELSTKDFETPNNEVTNVSGGIDYATKLFYNLKKTLGEDDYKNALKYTILLYDGQPNYTLLFNTSSGNTLSNQNDDYYSDSYLFNSSKVTTSFLDCESNYCMDYIKTASNYLKGADTIGSELITIGYQFSSKNTGLKEISSQNSTLCSKSDYSGYCYYEAETSNSTTTISDLLTSIQNSITTEVNKTEAKTAVVRIVFNEKIDGVIDNFEGDSVCEKKRTKDNNVLLECTLELDKDADMNSSYKLALVENALVCAEGVKNCTTNIKVFESFTVTTYNEDNNEISTKSWNNSPTIAISQTSFYTVNDYKNESKY